MLSPILSLSREPWQGRSSDPIHDQVIAWIFPTDVATHMLLVAALRNPTVRRRYVSAREVLTERGEIDFYERLLGPLPAPFHPQLALRRLLIGDRTPEHSADRGFELPLISYPA